jgi:hypothetical protein
MPVNPPPFHRSLPHKSLISRMDWVSCAGDINLPHTPFPSARSPSNKKIKYNKILTYILRSIFLEIPHLELPRWWKMPRDTNGKGVRMISGYWSVWHLYKSIGSWRLIKVLMIIQQLSTDWQLIGDKEVGLWHTLRWLEVW